MKSEKAKLAHERWRAKKRNVGTFIEPELADKFNEKVKMMNSTNAATVRRLIEIFVDNPEMVIRKLKQEV